MANTIHIDIVSAEGELHSGEATMIFAPASGGEIGIAPRHAPLLTTLKPGEVRVQTEGGEELLFWVGGGALEVQPHKVTVLADTASRAKDLDEAAALAAKRIASSMGISLRRPKTTVAVRASLAPVESIISVATAGIWPLEFAVA